LKIGFVWNIQLIHKLVVTHIWYEETSKRFTL
jgi:hypothetical protein